MSMIPVITGKTLVITGTDTNVGKTVVAAGLCGALKAAYWKPIQAGTEDGTDSAWVQSLGGVPKQRMLQEAYRFHLAASPHLAAEVEGETVELEKLAMPKSYWPLIVEGAGGVLVPIRRDPPWLYIDQFALWGAPVLLVARTGLGTINHTLLSIAALRLRKLSVAGVIFVGDGHPDNEKLIPELGHVRHLGRIPVLDPLNAKELKYAVEHHVDLETIRAIMANS